MAEEPGAPLGDLTMIASDAEVARTITRRAKRRRFIAWLGAAALAIVVATTPYLVHRYLTAYTPRLLDEETVKQWCGQLPAVAASPPTYVSGSLVLNPSSSRSGTACTLGTTQQADPRAAFDPERPAASCNQILGYDRLQWWELGGIHNSALGSPDSPYWMALFVSSNKYVAFCSAAQMNTVEQAGGTIMSFEQTQNHIPVWLTPVSESDTGVITGAFLNAAGVTTDANYERLEQAKEVRVLSGGAQITSVALNRGIALTTHVVSLPAPIPADEPLVLTLQAVDADGSVLVSETR